MLKQLIYVKSNKIFVLQTAGRGTSCPASVWQTDLHTGTATVCEPALSLLHTTAAIYLYAFNLYVILDSPLWHSLLPTAWEQSPSTSQLESPTCLTVQVWFRFVE